MAVPAIATAARVLPHRGPVPPARPHRARPGPRPAATTPVSCPVRRPDGMTSGPSTRPLELGGITGAASPSSDIVGGMASLASPLG